MNKVGIRLKELKESSVNLKIFKTVNYGNPSKIPELLDEEQLIKILATMIKNKK